MKFSLLIAASILLVAPSAAHAFNREEKICFADIIEAAYNERKAVIASTVVRMCACDVNMRKQGLSVHNCPYWIGIDETRLRQHGFKW